MPWSRVLAFTDPFLFQTAIQGGQVEILPTARGTFHADLTQIGMNKVWMQRFDVTLPVIGTVAANTKRKVFGFLTDDASSHLQHCGLEVAPNDLLIYGKNVLHQRSQSRLQYAAISVPLNDFPALCRTIIGREFPEDSDTSVVRPDASLMSRLRKLHRLVGQLAHDSPDVLLIPEVLRALENHLIHVLVRCLADGASTETKVGRPRHNAILTRFEEFLAANPDRPLYLSDICAGVGVAERTLRASCEEHLGMGPIRFLTLRRMHLVRAALLRANAVERTVTSIITDHGFWELGRFSVTYRTLFGESPSDTLRRSVADCATRNPGRPLAVFSAAAAHKRRSGLRLGARSQLAEYT